MADPTPQADTSGTDLAQSGYMTDVRFVAYLAYLRYWQAPPYVHFVRYVRAVAVK
jgi:hypothetical protein